MEVIRDGRSGSGFLKMVVRDLAAPSATPWRQTTESLRQRLPMHGRLSTRYGGEKRAHHNLRKTHGTD